MISNKFSFDLGPWIDRYLNLCSNIVHRVTGHRQLPPTLWTWKNC